MDPRTRKELTFTIAFALGRCRSWLRDMLRPQPSDEARMRAAETIVAQIELSNFTVEQGPTNPPHATPDARPGSGR